MPYSHRSGPLKQLNKQHKGEKKRSDSKLKGVSRKANKTQSKQERRAANKQKRAINLSLVKKSIGSRGTSNNPLWCALVPLTQNVSAHLASVLLQKCDPDAPAIQDTDDNLQDVVHIHPASLNKHFALVEAHANDLFGCIDLIQMADWTIILVPSDFTELDASSEAFLTALYSSGLGDVSYAVMSSNADLKEIKRSLGSRFPIPEDTIYALNNPANGTSLLRHICSSKSAGYVAKGKSTENGQSSSRFRASLMAASIELNDKVPEQEVKEDSAEIPTETYLVVKGQLRGAPLYFNEPLAELAKDHNGPFLHLPGWGDFPMARAVWSNQHVQNRCWSLSEHISMHEPAEENILQPSTLTTGLNIESDDSASDSIAVSSDDEEMDGDNKHMSENNETPITDEVMEPDFVVNDDEIDDAAVSSYAARTMATSKGSTFSHAQLAKFRDARTEEMFPDELETPVDIPARVRFAKYRSLPRFHGSTWPVTKDAYPIHYENIACFRNYHRNRRSVIRYLQERQAKRHLSSVTSSKFIPPGSLVQLTIGPMRRDTADMIISRHTRQPGGARTLPNGRPHPLIIWSLLPHENRISVCHFSMQRVTSALRFTSDLVIVANAAQKATEAASAIASGDPSGTLGMGEEASTGLELQDEAVRDALVEHRRATVRKSSTFDANNPTIPPEAEPIKSKELMVFQVGIRRFISAPIYSTQTTSTHEKAKYEAFFSASQSSTVTSVYAPVTYSPTNVLQFRIRVDENEEGELSPPYLGELVATGSLHSVDPARLIIKRILLSGHPYKIHQRTAVVRFMFFNPTDIDYFRAVSLHTKTGASGHIKEPVGTHGHMKCMFDRILQASDIILMPLYKRVFPKWLYQPTIARIFKFAAPVDGPEMHWSEAPDTLQLGKKRGSLDADTLSIFE